MISCVKLYVSILSIGANGSGALWTYLDAAPFNALTKSLFLEQERENVILDFLKDRVTFPGSLKHLDLYGLGLPVSLRSF